MKHLRTQYAENMKEKCSINHVESNEEMLELLQSYYQKKYKVELNRKGKITFDFKNY